ncbi:MAG: sugar dehydrogenase [Gammaproteobacteria bacterium]
MRKITLLLVLLLCHAAIADTALPRQTQRLTVAGEDWLLRVPAGMQLEVLTDRLEQPRLMTFLSNGDLLTGSRSGHIYRLAPPYTQPEVLVSLDGYPHSLAWRAGELLIARTDGLYRAPYSPGQKTIRADSVELLLALPGGGSHNSRSVAIGPDGRVYLSLGITGNCSNEYLHDGYAFNVRRGGVLVLDESGKQPVWRPYAAGLRNPVGFDWHPDTGVLYASNNGPDHLGYEQPPEYFARLTDTSFHGMPWFQFDGTRLQRDDCIGSRPPRPAGEVSLPVAIFPARNAPMGVAFVPPAALDGRFNGNAIVALRGSWGTRPKGSRLGNRATRRPPALVMVQFDGDKTGGVVDLVTGFQRDNGQRLARPVGVAFGPDGALYFTSDSHLEGLFRLRPQAR